MNLLITAIKINLLILIIDYFIFVVIRLYEKNDNKLQAIKYLSTFFSILIYIFLAAINKIIFNLFIFITLLFNGYIYFHVINMMITSRRIKLLEYMIVNENSNYKELQNIYTAENMISKRIERLKISNQIYEINDKLFSKNIILLFAAEILYFISILFNARWDLIYNIKTKKNKIQSNK